MDRWVDDKKFGWAGGWMMNGWMILMLLKVIQRNRTKRNRELV
jgi:hypothetical protein